MKYIREARMGLPKSFKTGAIAGTYPKPMLALMFDEGGLDIIPSKSNPTPPGLIAMNVSAEDIVWTKPADFPTWLGKPASEQPKILAVNFYGEIKHPVTFDVKQYADSSGMQAFVNVMDALYTHLGTGKPLPWQTGMLDSLTGLTDVVLCFIAKYNPASLADARQWAAQAGIKVKQACAAMNGLPWHSVTILHSTMEKNELTSVVNELPNVYSKLRDELSYMFSQFFYALKDGTGKPIIWTTDKMYVKSLGPRWPVGLPTECQPDFKSIYGKEIQS